MNSEKNGNIEVLDSSQPVTSEANANSVNTISADKLDSSNTIEEIPSVNPQVSVSQVNNSVSENTNTIEEIPSVSPQVSVSQVNNSVSENTNTIEEIPSVNPQVNISQIDNKANDNNNTLLEDSNTIEGMPSSSLVDNDNRVEIKKAATIKSEVGTSIIGEITGDTIKATNNPLPDKININVKAKAPTKSNGKKVKVVTKRDKIMGVLVTVLVLLVLFGGGFTVYYFAYLNNPSIYTVKNLSFEYGDDLPSNISFYITSPKSIDGMEYSLDVSTVGTDIGTYSYTVTHKSVSKTGTIIIKDTKGPTITFKDNLNFSKGSTITKEDLVSSCDDPSNCTYKIDGSIDTNVSGKASVNIIANDDIGNITTSTVDINIIDISKTLVCTSSSEESTDYNTVIEDTVNFDSSNNVVSSTSKKIISYINLNAFFELYNNEKDNTDYSFDKVNFKYSTNNDINLGAMKTLTEIQNYYSKNGYTCK